MRPFDALLDLLLELVEFIHEVVPLGGSEIEGLEFSGRQVLLVLHVSSVLAAGGLVLDLTSTRPTVQGTRASTGTHAWPATVHTTETAPVVFRIE